MKGILTINEDGSQTMKGPLQIEKIKEPVESHYEANGVFRNAEFHSDYYHYKSNLEIYNEHVASLPSFPASNFPKEDNGKVVGYETEEEFYEFQEGTRWIPAKRIVAIPAVKSTGEGKEDETQHELKTWTPYFQQVCDGLKKFELRKNDRGFKVGDTLLLKEWKPSGYSDVSPNKMEGEYTGREILVKVTYLFQDKSGTGWISSDYCIMGIEPVSPSNTETATLAIQDTIGRMGELEKASIKYFLETGTINGSFRQRLVELYERKHPQPVSPANREEDDEYPTYEQAGGDKKWDDMTELEKAYYNLRKTKDALAVCMNTAKRRGEQLACQSSPDKGVSNIVGEFGRPMEYWKGFDYALELLDSMYASTHPHPYNISDCIKAKVNRMPKSKIRENNNPIIDKGVREETVTEEEIKKEAATKYPAYKDMGNYQAYFPCAGNEEKAFIAGAKFALSSGSGETEEKQEELTSIMQMHIGRMEVNCFDEDGEMSIRVGGSKYQSLTVDEAKELLHFLKSHIHHETEANPSSNHSI